MAEYQILLSREIGSRLDAKCDKLADVVAIDDIGQSALLASFHLFMLLLLDFYTF